MLLYVLASIRVKHVYRFLPILLVCTSVALNVEAQPQPGNCELGVASGTLEANDVLAWLPTTGTLFFGPDPPPHNERYVVPKNEGVSPLFASSVWVGGLVDGELRTAATTYGQAGGGMGYEFWPGSLNEGGTLPNSNDCSEWDHVWSVSRADIIEFEQTGNPTADLAEWPNDLGAPVIDGDGDPDNYNLHGGDRPDLIGDQALWWILNDVGNEHLTTQTAPIGLEMRVHAYAFATADALDQATFYKFTLVHRGEAPLDSTHFALFADPDLGDAGDDLIGSDTTHSMGYVYNESELDSPYGSPPPALGLTVIQGPLVPAAGEIWEDPDGTIYADMTRLGMTVFSTFYSSATGTGNPSTATHYWNYLRGFWRDGSPIRECASGFHCEGPITTFMYPGDPVTGEGWFEPQDNGADKRFMVSTGPFTMQPGDEQEIVVGVVFGWGEDRFDSITELRAASDRALAFHSGNLPAPAAASPPPLCDDANPDRQPGSDRCFMATALDTSLVLSWGFAPEDDGFLGNYVDEFVYETADGDIVTMYSHAFEGFNLYEYDSAQFDPNDRRLIASFDKENGITEVFNGVFDPVADVHVPEQSAWGEDSGLDYSLRVNSSFRHSGPLRNYTDYYFGLTTYTVDESRVTSPVEGVNWRHVGEAVLESMPTLLSVRPSKIRNADGGTTLSGKYGRLILPDSTESNMLGDGTVYATVADISRTTGDTYVVEFYAAVDEQDEATHVITYDIVNVTMGEVLFSGQDYFDRTGEAPPNVENTMVFDGLSFTILGREPEFLDIVDVTPDGDEQSFDCAVVGTDAHPYLIASAGVDPCQNQGSLLDNVDWINGQPSAVEGIQALSPWDIEIRFIDDPADGQYIFNRTWDGADPDQALMGGWVTADEGNGDCELLNEQVHVSDKLPFTVWEVSPTGEERQVMAAILNDDGDNVFSCSPLWSEFSFDRPTYERIYINHGEYDEQAIEDDVIAAYDEWGFWEIQAQPIRATAGRFLIAPNFEPVGLPEPGTTIRFVTSKSNLPEDRYVFNTSELMASRGEGLTQADIDRIGVVPNPYIAFSAYETANDERVARFTNLPQRATIRIYTIAGARVRTLEKDDASRSFDWDLRNGKGRLIGSGLYLIHVELPESGFEKVLKFGVINREEVSEL